MGKTKRELKRKTKKDKRIKKNKKDKRSKKQPSVQLPFMFPMQTQKPDTSSSSDDESSAASSSSTVVKAGGSITVYKLPTIRLQGIVNALAPSLEQGSTADWTNADLC